MEILNEYYLWFLAFHLISVMFWMAGIYYLPRLFVYHTEAYEAKQPFSVFETMEAKLLRIIMNPAMIAAWIFAILMIIRPGFLEIVELWFWIKLVSVIILTIFHMFLARTRHKLAEGIFARPSAFYRKINEIPPILTVIIVIMVIVKPF
ncbi:protoporphyrinogen oxidase HemJ [Alphaproteobacteria bacterium]|nr:protoporphyrinogen oxidase HemJ [Alphaproteobacteria bacterium]